MSGQGDEPDAVLLLDRLAGWILIVVGGLIFSLSGLCTGWFLFPVVTASHLQVETVGVAFGLAAVVGGLPMFAGAFLCWVGWGYAHGRRR